MNHCTGKHYKTTKTLISAKLTFVLLAFEGALSQHVDIWSGMAYLALPIHYGDIK